MKKYLSLSGADLWTECPGVLQAVKNPIAKSNGRMAKFGTLTHDVAEALAREFDQDPPNDGELSVDLRASALAIKTAPFTITKEEAETLGKDVAFYLQNIDFDGEIVSGYDTFAEAIPVVLKHFIKAPTSSLTYYFLETGLLYPFSKTSGIRGRADLITIEFDMLRPNRGAYELQVYVSITDLKTGWVKVEASESEQLKITAEIVLLEVAKALDKLKLKSYLWPDVNLTIIQPPLFIFDSHPTVLPTSVKDLKARLDGYKKHLKSPKTKPKLKSGAHCVYCPLQDICPTFKKALKEFLKPKFQDLTYDRLGTWAQLHELLKPVSKSAETIGKLIRSYIELGKEIPGYYLEWVGGKRVPISETKMRQEIASHKKLKVKDFLEDKLKGIPAIEKLLKINGVDPKEFLEGKFYQPTSPRLKKIAEPKK